MDQERISELRRLQRRVSPWEIIFGDGMKFWLMRQDRLINNSIFYFSMIDCDSMVQLPLLIEHKVENSLIPQRAIDGYVNATAMCKAVRKQFNNYYRLQSTGDFLKELSAETGITVSELVQAIKGGVPSEQGT